MDTKATLDHHIAAFSAGDVDGVLEDYTDESVFLHPEGVVHGREALRGMYAELLEGLFKPGTYDFTMNAVHVEGDVAFIAWEARCGSADVPLGTDTFLIRDGKIRTHTFAAKIDPR